MSPTMHTRTGTTMIRYRDQIAAYATARQITFAVDMPEPDHRFIHAMGVYAGHVHTGELPGPYADELAERFARTLLIPDEDLAGEPDDAALAARLVVPVEQIAAARAER